ncbi:phosphate transporter subunit; membrane component of ABC superfamily [Burkholderiales bacterium]|nr:phosphate transporter subunit; membrane component of ABC superfamily [Burkholderiales bacterium]
MSRATGFYYRRRRVTDVFAKTLGVAATAFGLFWLFWILLVTLNNGMHALTPAIFTQTTPPPGGEGGLANALVGSFEMSLLGVLIGAPLGIAAGTYLSEFAERHPAWRETIRFVNDILLSAPSIVLGLFVYTLAVRSVGHFSGWSGAIALALIVLPVVVRTTDETLRLVPNVMREAALSLGIPRWKVTVQVLYRAAAPGILTGVLLGLARISGETAPLLFTALNNQFWAPSLNAPTSSVPVVVFQFAMSPYDSWHALAWAGAFIVTVFILLLSVATRAYLLRNRFDAAA